MSSSWSSEPHLGKLLVALVLEPHIARIDAILRQRLGARRVIGQKFVPDIMEIAHQRHVDPTQHQPVANMGNRCRSFVTIDGDAYDFRPRTRQRGDLGNRGLDVCRIGIGHRLHDDRGIAPHRYPADVNANCCFPLCWTRHEQTFSFPATHKPSSWSAQCYVRATEGT